MQDFYLFYKFFFYSVVHYYKIHKDIEERY